MGSGGGYIHAALWAVKEAHGFSDDDLLRGLFVAAGIGAIAYTRTAPTGEVTGCTGETGICGAMAAAAIAEMAGGTPEQVENAASLLLQAVIGMPCDPIAGGAGQPCRSRVLTTTCMAHVFADLALAGRDAILPLHEVIDVAGPGGPEPAAGPALHRPGRCGRHTDGPTQGHRVPRVVRHDRPRRHPPAAGELDLRQRCNEGNSMTLLEDFARIFQMPPAMLPHIEFVAQEQEIALVVALGDGPLTAARSPRSWRCR